MKIGFLCNILKKFVNLPFTQGEGGDVIPLPMIGFIGKYCHLYTQPLLCATDCGRSKGLTVKQNNPNYVVSNNRYLQALCKILYQNNKNIDEQLINDA